MHRNIIQRNFSTGLMRQVIFNHYVNECRTYVSFNKGFCTVYFGAKEDNAVTLTHSAQRKHAFTEKNQDV